MRRIILALFIAIGASLFIAQSATAHSTTVACAAPGVWSISNSQPDLSLTYTSPHIPPGAIAEGATVYVAFSGDELTIDATWSNGFTDSTTGYGECTEQTTTTDATTTTETSTTTTVPCEFNPELPPDDPGCQETTTTTSTPTTTSTRPGGQLLSS